MIENAAATALSDLVAVTPYDPGSPCEIRVQLATSDEVERYRHHAAVEIVDGRTLVSRANDWWHGVAPVLLHVLPRSRGLSERCLRAHGHAPNDHSRAVAGAVDGNGSHNETAGAEYRRAEGPAVDLHRHEPGRSVAARQRREAPPVPGLAVASRALLDAEQDTPDSATHGVVEHRAGPAAAAGRTRQRDGRRPCIDDRARRRKAGDRDRGVADLRRPPERSLRRARQRATRRREPRSWRRPARAGYPLRGSSDRAGHPGRTASRHHGRTRRDRPGSRGHWRWGG